MSCCTATVFAQAKPGAPRAWEAGIPAGPFSVFNSANGNLLTVVPLVGFDPVGPAVGFTLYHNSASAAANESGSAGQGFSLGYGWSTSYSGRVLTGGSPIVVEDDGTQNQYTAASGVFSPPAGVHDHLAYDDNETPNDSSDDRWILTRLDQSRRVFNADGLLTEVQDAVGNAVVIERDTNGRIEAIVSAAEGRQGVSSHRIELAFDTNGFLEQIEDPIGREWGFEHSSGRLIEVEFPSDTTVPVSHVKVTYATSNRIASIESRDELVWSLTYATFPNVLTVTDPGPSGGPYTQKFGATSVAQNGDTSRQYTDRRNKVWTHTFDPSKRLIAVKDPLNKTSTLAYDSDNNVVAACDPLGNCWEAEYGAAGNLEVLRGPELSAHGDAQQEWTLDWEQPDDEGRPNFWRLTRITDPLEHWVEYAYENETYPTLVTKIIEMEAETSGDPAEHAIEYFLNVSGAENSHGQLKLFTDANGVKHKFAYDAWGYTSSLQEGWFPTIGSAPNPVAMSRANDAMGRPTESCNDAACGEPGFNPNDDLTQEYCVVLVGGPPPARLGHPAAPALGASSQCSYGNSYDVARRPLVINRCMGGLRIEMLADRSTTFAYDSSGLKRLLSITVSHTEGEQDELVRRFDFGYTNSEAAGATSITGPDGSGGQNGQTTELAYDDLARVESIVRSSPAGDLGVSYTYDDSGRVTQVENGNGSDALYTYDEVDRVTRIVHKTATDATLLDIEYTYNLDNTVAERVETDNVNSTVATVTFDYDNRQRLTNEARVVGSTTTYDIEYSYDQLGNRKTRYESVSDLHITYTYDTDTADPSGWDFPTKNNRLLEYKIRDGGPTGTLLRTVKYTYYKTGDVCSISLKDEWTGGGSVPDAYDWWYDLAFYPYTNGTLAMVATGRFKLDHSGSPDPNTYVRTAAREFAYDSPRARFLSRDLVHEIGDPNEFFPTGTQRWTDYLGDLPYGDFDVTLTGGLPGGTGVSPVVSESMRYLGTSAQQQVSGGATRQYHGDLIHSTMLLTDDDGAALSSNGTLAYTAFGEPVTGAGIGFPPTFDTRYQYAGGWGYETGLLSLQGPNTSLAPLSFQHVGARWYQPEIGRFVQRDPIGLAGDVNVYSYVSNEPTSDVDPDGQCGLRRLLGPSGPIFGRGRLRPGQGAGVLNRGNVRLGWSWVPGKGGAPGGNRFALHGGRPGTPGHWHLYPNHPFTPSGPGPAPAWARFCVGATQIGLVYGAAEVGFAAGGAVSGLGVSDWIGDRLWDLGGTRPVGLPGYRPY